MGRFGRTALGKTYSLVEPPSFFHACKTPQAYSDKGIGSADAGVFTLLVKRINLLSKSTWDQRNEKPSL
jgi:hypothetical protein